MKRVSTWEEYVHCKEKQSHTSATKTQYKTQTVPVEATSLNTLGSHCFGPVSQADELQRCSYATGKLIIATSTGRAVALVDGVKHH